MRKNGWKGEFAPERMKEIRREAEEAVKGKGEAWWNPPRE